MRLNSDKFYVKAILRDDGKRFNFDGERFFLATDNTLLKRPEIESTEVEYTEADGGEMINQRSTIGGQDFNGLMYPKDKDYWELYFTLTSFFKKNYSYTVIYTKRNGEMFAQYNGWLSSNIQIVPRPKEDYSYFSFGVKFRNSLLYEYLEDNDGTPTYTNSVKIPLLSADLGGEVWDAVGTVWDEVGEVWEAGEGGVQNVYVRSSERIYPIWTVVGPCVKPKIQVNNTDTFAEYDGTVGTGQKLTVDFSTGEARLNTALVTRNVRGSIYLEPAMNIVGFDSEGGTTKYSMIMWNGALG